MLGNFKYCNPTKLYFGDESLEFLSDELKNYGKNFVLIYGGGSIKKNGIYDDVINILKQNNKKALNEGAKDDTNIRNNNQKLNRISRTSFNK